jgi:hypothetical protein
MQYPLKFSDNIDIDELLKKAPEYINSFMPGHWDFMQHLEERGKIILERDPIEDDLISFFADIAYLKRPHNFDKEGFREKLSPNISKINSCVEQIRNIDSIDYQVLDYIGKIPYFGVNGGRSFASAVLRIIRPDKYGIIDWRNMAVMANSKGFEGLLAYPIIFNNYTPDKIIKDKGHMFFSQDLYIEYNNSLRELANIFMKTPAEIDLILWAYSIKKQPFGFQPILSGSYFNNFIRKQVDLSKRKDVHAIVPVLVNKYLDELKEVGNIPRNMVFVELESIFQFVLDEFKEYARNRNNLTVQRIIKNLQNSINSGSDKRLLYKWKSWEDKLNPAVPGYIGNIQLPGSMYMEGFVVFEQLIPIREYFIEFYEDESFQPKFSAE